MVGTWLDAACKVKDGSVKTTEGKYAVNPGVNTPENARHFDLDVDGRKNFSLVKVAGDSLRIGMGQPDRDGSKAELRHVKLSSITFKRTSTSTGAFASNPGGTHGSGTGPTERTAQPPIAGIVGTWKATCATDGSMTADLSMTFTADGSFSATFQAYNEKECKTKKGPEERATGKYVAGFPLKPLAPGVRAIDMSIDGKGTQYSIVRVNGNKLEIGRNGSSREENRSEDFASIVLNRS